MNKQISAKIITDSISAVSGKRITTMELEYPRFIHGEFLTHRLFSRNSASSRAIPVSKIIGMVDENPATPIHWGKNQPGMQAYEELRGEELAGVQSDWREASSDAVMHASVMNHRGAHKQIVNRILEPFQWMKTVVTATEFDNFFWLRNHPDAQPEIKRLAEVMLQALGDSKPNVLRPGEWHLPYVHIVQDPYTVEYAEYYDSAELNTKYTLEEALAISASCCAQVSYRKLDDSLEKAKDIFAKLIESKPCHASPCEHQATPMAIHQPTGMREDGYKTLNIESHWLNVEEGLSQQGVTHMDSTGRLWSGNFRGWVQHRQLIHGNVCSNYKDKNND